jgi:hypothetical protein
VGTIYDEEVYIADNYPSLNQGKSPTYTDTTKTIVSFKKPLKMVEDAIEFLLDSEYVSRTREIAIERLQAAGLEVTDVPRDKTKYPDLHFEICYHGEKVGDIYENEMYLATALPSLEQLGVFTSVYKSSIAFGVQSAIDLLLTETLERLKTSAEKYDDLVREKRITDVRNYFKDREDTEFVKSLHDADRS